MKIGIITLPLIRNYGGILQAFALQKFLKDKGHEVVIIDRHFNEDILEPLKRFIKKSFFYKKYQSSIEEKLIIAEPTHFINNYLKPKSPKITSENQLKAYVLKENFDVFITGSDQVWRLDYASGLTKNMFLNFAPSNTKKISYAASFGVDQWMHNQETTEEIKALIKGLNKVSVREDSGVEICNKYFEISAKQHLDPTMLLTKETYIQLAKSANEPNFEGNLLVYMLDVSKDRAEAIDTVAKTLSTKPFIINAKSQNKDSSISDRKYPSVTSWLQGFADAEFAIIDSFHGSVFSILFNIPFIAYGNVKRGLTRFTSLLKLFDLEDRLVLDKNEITNELINKKIDWKSVNSKLKKYRQESELYFREL